MSVRRETVSTVYLAVVTSHVPREDKFNIVMRKTSLFTFLYGFISCSVEMNSVCDIMHMVFSGIQRFCTLSCFHIIAWDNHLKKY